MIARGIQSYEARGLWRTVAGGLAMLGVAGCHPEPEPPPPHGTLPMCGGFAAIPCPGAGQCVDDPSDSCDPETGGADCSGVCECDAVAECEAGLVWDASPLVCACVEQYDPCIATLCPTGTECINDDGHAICVPFEGEACGETTCGAGEVCCNASCGICTPPDGVCIQIACE